MSNEKLCKKVNYKNNGNKSSCIELMAGGEVLGRIAIDGKYNDKLIVSLRRQMCIPVWHDTSFRRHKRGYH